MLPVTHTAFHRISSALLALLFALVCAGANADGVVDHDAARKALEAGDILPLRTILDRAETTYPGRVLEVELERKGGYWIYEIKILQADGLVVKLNFDAKDGSLIKTKSK